MDDTKNTAQISDLFGISLYNTIRIVKAGWATYKIILVDNLYDCDGECDGMVLFDDTVILLNRELLHKPDIFKESLLHEIFHIVINQFGGCEHTGSGELINNEEEWFVSNITKNFLVINFMNSYLISNLCNGLELDPVSFFPITEVYKPHYDKIRNNEGKEIETDKGFYERIHSYLYEQREMYENNKGSAWTNLKTT